MRNIFTISFALIKEKKIQNFLIGLVIFLCAALFSSSIGALLNLDNLFLEVCEKQKASHIILGFDKHQYNHVQINKWFNEHEDVESTSLLSVYDIKGEIYINNQKVENAPRLVEYNLENRKQDLLKIVEGDQKNMPGIREVWVPTGFAYAKNIKVGDEITIPAGDKVATFKVSAIVVDPLFTSNLITPSRIWVAPGEISTFVPFSECNKVRLYVRYSDYSKQDKIWREFESYLGEPFGGFKFDFDIIFNGSTIISRIVTQVMFGFAILITIIMIIIISFMISNSILSEYKTIGVYKAQGFSNTHIILIYIFQYMFLGIIAVPLGCLASKVIAKLIMANFLKAMGLVEVQLKMSIPALITFILVLTIIFTVVLLTVRKIRKVKPVEAIRFGGNTKKNISKGINKMKFLIDMPIHLFISVKEVLYDMKKTSFLCIMILTMTFMFFSTNSIITSLKNTVEEGGALGVERSDISIYKPDSSYGFSNEYILKKILNNEYVNNVVPKKILSKSLIKINNQSENILGIAYKGDMDSIGLVNLEGRHPKTHNEITLAKITSEETGKKIGDHIDLYIEGRKATFLITGIYQTVSNFGRGYRIRFSAVEKINPTIEANYFEVSLEEGADPQEVKLMFKKELSSPIDVGLIDELISQVADPIILNVIRAMSVISLIIIIVCSISIFNYITLSIYEQKKNYGIYKVMGLSPKQIRWILVCRVEIITVVATVLGFVLMLLFSPEILDIILKNFGCSRGTFSMDSGITLLTIPFTMALTGLSAWIASVKVKNISPRELIVE